MEKCCDRWKHYMRRDFTATDPEDGASTFRLASERSLSLLGETNQPGAFAKEHDACLREGDTLRASVEQALPEVILQSAHRLTHSGLRPVQLRRRT
jgi:hypothetical protein